jgi:tRNA(fMet)-specific endonuclease VapC
MLKYMLDTNICIYVIKRKPLEALAKFNENAGALCISSITMAELYHGAEKSEQCARNMAIVEDFISRLDVLHYGEKAAAHYGDIRANLEKRGSIIGVNDLHIAAHARSESLILVSNNLKEFDRVEGLRSCNWI